jgi:hypothetical protein
MRRHDVYRKKGVYSGHRDEKQTKKVDKLTESSNNIPQENCTVAADLKRYTQGLKYSKKKKRRRISQDLGNKPIYCGTLGDSPEEK